jgi:hypothetical protein
MPTLTLTFSPTPLTLGLLREPQLCYVLLTVRAAGTCSARAVNWALVADASRSMRIPIVDEAQFRTLVRHGGAQEALVDGVPVWQLNGPVPPDVRAAAQSALDQVAHALHTVVERLDAQDRFALIACAEEAVLLARSTAGDQRAELARGIARLKGLNLGEQTDLARGIELGLHELRRGRAGQRAERLLLLTDGFTQRPEACLQLAGAAAAEGVTICTIGLGGEFQVEVLTALADRSGGRALFLRTIAEIPRAVASELAAARTVAARSVALRVAPAPGVALRRATRIRPSLTALFESPSTDGAGAGPIDLHLGDLEAPAPAVLLLEFLAPPHAPGHAPLGQLVLTAEGVAAVQEDLLVSYQASAPLPPLDVLDAAARASAARLQRRALAALASSQTAEAIRLLRAAATRLDDLGERTLAEAARGQAAALEHTGRADSLAAKELAYATRRLGEA